MPLILVTGTSTSGKSTIAKELLKRGYEAYDTEHNGVSGWYSKETGERVAGFNEAPERTAVWLNRHEWRISVDWVTQVAKKAHGKLIFLCGGGADEPAIRPLCDWVIWLKTDEATIRRRVVIPRDHDYGTKPHELAAAIENNKQREAEYRKYGATIVDATQPLDMVVKDILTEIGGAR